MIRYLDNQEKGRTKDLWREAFPEDSEDFLDYYDQEKMSINQVLVREEDDALARIEELDALGCQPFAQPYRDFENKIRPTPEQRRLARWCNHKPTFHTVNYKNYKE